jgi:penicillin-binding protein 2
LASTDAAGPGRRFLPGDPRVEEPYRLTPQLAFRVAMLAFLALGVFAVLFLRLWALQILSGDRYLAAAADNRVRTIRIDAPRGPILDRNGKVLVENVPGTRLELWPADLPKTWPAERRELHALALVTGVSVREMLARMREYTNDPLTPIVIQRGLTEEQVAYLDEHSSEFPGVRLAESWLRKYPHRSLAAQVLGYVGRISPAEYKRLRKQGYQPTDAIGQSGVEYTYDNYLRGRDGTAQLTVDSLGRARGAAVVETNPTPGEALRLTIDIDLQRAAERALTYGIQLARSTLEGAYANGGAIVALDPNTGAILAMASNPTYKPSIFVGTPDRRKLAPLLDPAVAARDNNPGIDRATAAAYPPGSAWKPVTALAAMQEHLLTPFEPILCSPDLIDHGQRFSNWTPLVDSYIDLKTALAMSCDTYFYRVGQRFYNLPGNRGHPLQAWANRFGFGEPSGIDIGGETTGLVPTPEWRRETFSAAKGYGAIDRIWKPGYSIQLAIGQGDLLVTPLQMARFYAMVANGGKLVTPHLGEDVELTGSARLPLRVLRRFGAQAPEPAGVDPSALAVVQQGLEEATHASIGTSSGVFGNFTVDIAGKTGSAEKVVRLPGYPSPLKLTQSWWCGYGPYNAPQLVVCAMIENGGHGGTAAAPAALKVFEQYFRRKATVSSHPSD